MLDGIAEMLSQLKSLAISFFVLTSTRVRIRFTFMLYPSADLIVFTSVLLFLLFVQGTEPIYLHIIRPLIKHHTAAIDATPLFSHSFGGFYCWFQDTLGVHLECYHGFKAFLEDVSQDNDSPRSWILPIPSLQHTITIPPVFPPYAQT